MKKLALISLLVIAIGACKSRLETHKKDFENFYFYAETTPCFGACPIYTMEVNQMGVASLNAIKFVEDLGLFVTSDSSFPVRLLMDQVKVTNWDTLGRSYKTGYSDLPSVIFKYSVEPGDTTEVIFEYEAAPPQLQQLANEVEKVRKNAKWISVNLD